MPFYQAGFFSVQPNFNPNVQVIFSHYSHKWKQIVPSYINAALFPLFSFLILDETLLFLINNTSPTPSLQKVSPSAVCVPFLPWSFLLLQGAPAEMFPYIIKL